MTTICPETMTEKGKLFAAEDALIFAVKVLSEMQPTREGSIARTEAETALLWVEKLKGRME